MDDRLDTLRRFATETPEDPFPLYGVAMELKRLGRLDESAEAFATLGARFPDYVPRYLLHGQVLETLGREDEAQAVYTAGLERAQAAGEDHAAMELTSALAALE